MYTGYCPTVGIMGCCVFTLLAGKSFRQNTSGAIFMASEMIAAARFTAHWILARDWQATGKLLASYWQAARNALWQKGFKHLCRMEHDLTTTMLAEAEIRTDNLRHEISDAQRTRPIGHTTTSRGAQASTNGDHFS